MLRSAIIFDPHYWTEIDQSEGWNFAHREEPAMWNSNGCRWHLYTPVKGQAMALGHPPPFLIARLGIFGPIMRPLGPPQSPTMLFYMARSLIYPRFDFLLAFYSHLVSDMDHKKHIQESINLSSFILYVPLSHWSDIAYAVIFCPITKVTSLFLTGTIMYAQVQWSGSTRRHANLPSLI